MIKIQ